jgi:hypothetical protein
MRHAVDRNGYAVSETIAMSSARPLRDAAGASLPRGLTGPPSNAILENRSKIWNVALVRQ